MENSHLARTLPPLSPPSGELRKPSRVFIGADLAPSLLHALAETGTVEIRDGTLPGSGGALRVAVTLSRREEADACGEDFFDVALTSPVTPGADAAPAASRSVEARAEEFLQKLSHDLRTPMSALQLWIKVIVEGDEAVPPGVREALEAIRHCAEEQQALIAGVTSRPFPA